MTGNYLLALSYEVERTLYESSSTWEGQYYLLIHLRRCIRPKTTRLLAASTSHDQR